MDDRDLKVLRSVTLSENAFAKTELELIQRPSGRGLWRMRETRPGRRPFDVCLPVTATETLIGALTSMCDDAEALRRSFGESRQQQERPQQASPAKPAKPVQWCNVDEDDDDEILIPRRRAL